MSAILNDDMTNDEGGSAAQTGNLVHHAAAAFHRTAASMGLQARTEEGLAALEAARQTFPEGNVGKAVETFGKYAADPENQDAHCPWVEHPVHLELAAAPHDPTGEPIVIKGTLDQVRQDKYGRLTLWDIKTGSRRTGKDSLSHYAIQQACYLLAARAMLSDKIEPGGLIYTPGYEKKLGKRFFSYTSSVEDCRLLMSTVVLTVALVRSGYPLFRPSNETCEWCRCESHEHCIPEFRATY